MFKKTNMTGEMLQAWITSISICRCKETSGWKLVTKYIKTEEKKTSDTPFDVHYSVKEETTKVLFSLLF